MASTDEKLDELIRCVADLKKSHEESQKDLDGKLKKLEDDFTATQQDVTESLEEGTEGTPLRISLMPK